MKRAIKASIIFLVFVLITFIIGYTIKHNKDFKIIDEKNSILKNDQVFIIKHNNLERKYIVHLPKDYNTSSKYPAVLAFHGGGGNAELSINYFELNQKADKEGFIVVYPEGVGVKVNGKVLGTWNGGTCCGYASDNNIDDVGFVDQVIENIKKDFNVDTKRTYATGMSNGAIMTYALSCELSHKIAAIAPVGSIEHRENCNQERPVPVLHIHGIDDPCAIYEGCDECKSCTAAYLNKINIPTKTRTGKAISVQSFFGKLKQRNNCSEEKNITFKNEDTTCETYSKCQNNAEVTLCSIKNLGHTWPGNTEYKTKACQTYPNGKYCKLWKETMGKTNDSYSANDAMWEFFKKYSL